MQIRVSDPEPHFDLDKKNFTFSRKKKLIFVRKIKPWIRKYFNSWIWIQISKYFKPFIRILFRIKWMRIRNPDSNPAIPLSENHSGFTCLVMSKILLWWYPPQRVEGFVEAILLGRDIDKHEGLAVPAQRVLQEVRQLGVPVGHVRALEQSKILCTRP